MQCMVFLLALFPIRNLPQSLFWFLFSQLVSPPPILLAFKIFSFSLVFHDLIMMSFGLVVLVFLVPAVYWACVYGFTVFIESRMCLVLISSNIFFCSNCSLFFFMDSDCTHISYLLTQSSLIQWSFLFFNSHFCLKFSKLFFCDV